MEHGSKRLEQSERTGSRAVVSREEEDAMTLRNNEEVDCRFGNSMTVGGKTRMGQK